MHVRRRDRVGVGAWEDAEAVLDIATEAGASVDPRSDTMKAALLAELADLFSREAFEKDKLGQSIEAERLWDISHDLHERFKKIEHAEARRPIR